MAYAEPKMRCPLCGGPVTALEERDGYGCRSCLRSFDGRALRGFAVTLDEDNPEHAALLNEPIEVARREYDSFVERAESRGYAVNIPQRLLAFSLVVRGYTPSAFAAESLWDAWRRWKARL